MLRVIQEQMTLSPDCFIQTVIWGLFTASLSLFLDKCFEEGMIFEKWLEFWAGWWMLAHGKQALYYDAHTYNDEEMQAKEGMTVREYLFEQVDWFWFKPLGGCVICMNVWISFLFMPFTGLNFVSQLFYICLSNITVRFSNELLH